MFMLSSIGCFAQPADSVYYFLNGVPNYFSQQHDVLSFQLYGNSEFTGYLDPTIVDKVEYFGIDEGIHNIYFSAAATDLEKEAVAYMLNDLPNFQKFYMVATKSSNYGMSYKERRWMGTDNQICIVFEDPQISLASVEAFAAEYQMRVLFAPAASIEGGVYVLEVNRNHNLYDYNSPTLSLEIARDMWIDHAAMIDRIAPSLRLFAPDDPSDALYGDQWWMEDDVPFACNGTEVAPATGIDLDCAWNYEHEFSDGPTYSGAGVVVGVIDFHGVQFSHPDCEDIFLNGYTAFGPDSTGHVAVIEIDADGGDLFRVAWNEAHLQNVSGVIAANIDNGIGSAGIAFGSKIIPCLQTGTTGQINSLIMVLLAETGDREVDILNLSLGSQALDSSEATFLPFYTALGLCHTNGRDEKGMIIIAAAGNDNGNYTQFPAIYSFVFSVAATNPLDQIKAIDDGFAPSGLTDFGKPQPKWGSNYSNYLDVAAPGICISSTDFSDDNPAYPDSIGDGYSFGDYNAFSGTSAAAPIVSGIAALLLEKDPTLENTQVYEAIRLSCDKVGGYTYSNPSPSGRTLKLGHGRVNACQALNVLDELSLEEENASFSFIHANPVGNELQVSIDGITNYSVVLMNITGQVVFSATYENATYFEIDMELLSTGLYYLNIIDAENNYTATSKVVKQ